MSRVKILVCLLLLLGAASPAVARRSDTRPYHSFGSKSCVTDACFKRHPGGRYRFPFHERHRK